MTTPTPPLDQDIEQDIDPRAALRWLTDAGVDVVLSDTPQDRMQPITATSVKQSLATTDSPKRPAASKLDEVANAEAIAADCKDLGALKNAMEAFDGCALKSTATQLVFSDGPAASDVMIIGEAPGRDEDAEGKPFVGAAGQLLNKILSAAGMPRESVYISNIVPWRPPGNRKPTDLETQICLPFIRRHIALAKPKALLLLGGTPATALTGKSDGITRLRGRWHSIALDAQTTLEAMPTFHPAYLLRQPGHKSFVWSDILMLKDKLSA